MLQCHMIYGCLSWQMQKLQIQRQCFSGGGRCKLYLDFRFHREWAPLAPMLFRVQLYLSQLISVSWLVVWHFATPTELHQSAESHCVDHNLSHMMFSGDGNNSIHIRSTRDRTEKLIVNQPFSSLPRSVSAAHPPRPPQMHLPRPSPSGSAPSGAASSSLSLGTSP